MSTALAALAVLAGAAAQSVSGIGFSLVSAPLLFALVGQGDGVRITLLLSLVLNAVVLVRERRGLLGRQVLVLLAGALPATPLFAALLGGVHSTTLTVAAGLTVVVAVALLASGLRWRAAAHPAGALAAGVVSAGMNVLAAVNGPAIAVYAENAGWSPDRLRPSLQAYFLVLNVVTVVTLGLPSLSPGRGLALLAGLLAGLAVGAAAVRRVPVRAARRVTLTVAAAGGLAVAVSALVGG